MPPNQKMPIFSLEGLLLLGLVALAGQPAGGQAKPDPGKPDAGWVSQHVDLDQLPVAYTVRSGRFAIGSAMRLTPAGFPADTYARYPDLAYGLTDRTELSLGVTGAQRLGPGGEAIFYNLGLQHVLLRGAPNVPALAVGGYAFAGPHDHNGGAVYLVASHQLSRRPYPGAVIAHLGLLLQGYSGNDSSAAPRPFVGANYVATPRFQLSAEFRPRMPWEYANVYSLRGVVLVTRRYGFDGGLRSNGYRVHPFIGFHLD
jgi:hypothetical protein